MMTISEINDLLKAKGLSHLKGEELQLAIAEEIELIIKKNDE